MKKLMSRIEYALRPRKRIIDQVFDCIRYAELKCTKSGDGWEAGRSYELRYSHQLDVFGLWDGDRCLEIDEPTKARFVVICAVLGPSMGD